MSVPLFACGKMVLSTGRRVAFGPCAWWRVPPHTMVRVPVAGPEAVEEEGGRRTPSTPWERREWQGKR
jgi:hypothetical protein